ncbi:MAG: putative oxidoreductase [Oleispira sp.]|jgi:putative oxidoreductase
MFTYSGIILILIFLLVTYSLSAYEKMFDWKKTFKDYCDMYKGIFNPILVRLSIIIILGIEIILSTIICIALYDIISVQSFLYAQYALVLSGFLIIILLVGLRLIKDYSGSSGLGIYFIISMMGLFWSQYM